MRTLQKYFDNHEDAGELLDPLVDHTETEEATKAKLKELNPLAKFGVCGHAHSSRQETSDALGSGPQERRNQSTIRRERVQG